MALKIPINSTIFRKKEKKNLWWRNLDIGFIVSKYIRMLWSNLRIKHNLFCVPVLLALIRSRRLSNVHLSLLSLFFRASYAKDLIKDTIQRNASPVRLEQSGGEKGAMGGSSSSLNSSASDESNRLQHNQQHNSRLRSSLLHSFSTNDASIGEYKYTVTVGNQSLKITGCNLDLVRVIDSLISHYSLYHEFDSMYL